MVDRLTGEQAAHQAEGLGEAGHPMVEGMAEGAVLALVPTGPEADDQTTTGDGIDRGRPLGEHRRLAETDRGHERPELDDLWDASIWVEVPFEVSVPRGNARFGEVDALGADPASEGNARYVGGQRLYLADVDPVTRATWVLDNTDLAAPVLLTGPLDVG